MYWFSIKIICRNAGTLVFSVFRKDQRLALQIQPPQQYAAQAVRAGPTRPHGKLTKKGLKEVTAKEAKTYERALEKERKRAYKWHLKRGGLPTEEQKCPALAEHTCKNSGF